MNQNDGFIDIFYTSVEWKNQNFNSEKYLFF